MKLNKIFSMTMLAFCVMSAFGQAKKPTLMVVPSDAWCKEHGYEQVFDNQGSEEKIPDYIQILIIIDLTAPENPPRILSKTNVFII